MTLRELRPGQSGVIVAVRCEGDLRRRLLDMGLSGGTLVRLLRVAPLGDPIEIALMGYELSLRRAQAEKIEIERIE